MDTHLNLIDGEWRPSGAAATFPDVNPADTRDVVGLLQDSGPADVEAAVASAAKAFPAWSQTPPSVRQGVFLKAADVLESRLDEIFSMLARETGCTLGFGAFQMHFVPGLLRQAAALAYAPLGEIIPSDTGVFSMGLRRPAGVVGSTPGHFEPTEKVRADFDVSFPVDI